MKVRFFMIEADDVSAADVAQIASEVFARSGASTIALPAPAPAAVLPIEAPTTRLPRPRKARVQPETPPTAGLPAAGPKLVQREIGSNGSTGRQPKRDIECLQHPGKLLTLDEAAELAGVTSASTVCGALSKAREKGSEWATVRSMNFRRSDGKPAPASNGSYEARSRHSHTAGPINAHINGAAARITHADHG